MAALLLAACAASVTAAEPAMESVHARARTLLEDSTPASSEEALRLIEEGLRAHPEAEPLHRLAGIAAFRLDRLERAEQAFLEAIRLAPGEPFNYLKLASLYLCSRKDAGRARSLMERLWQAVPDDLEGREGAAHLFARCGDADEAIGLYLGLASRHPERAWLYRFKAGQLYHAAGRYDDAETLLRRAVAEGGTEGGAALHAQLGATLARQGDRSGASEQYRLALDAAPDPELAARLRQELADLAR